MKGAVERIFDACSHVQLADGPAPLDDKMQEEILANVEALAEEGLRVLGFASKPWDGASSSSGEQADRGLVEKDLVLYGLQGLYDPPRPETKGSVKECHQAGIQVHMLTVRLPSLLPFLDQLLTIGLLTSGRPRRYRSRYRNPGRHLASQHAHAVQGIDRRDGHDCSSVSSLAAPALGASSPPPPPNRDTEPYPAGSTSSPMTRSTNCRSFRSSSLAAHRTPRSAWSKPFTVARPSSR